MADTFEIKHGDNLPVLVATLYSDANKTTPVDLTNATGVLLKVGDGEIAPLLDVAMTIKAPATAGQVEYQFTTANWGNIGPGQHNMEFQVTWTGGDIATYPKTGYKTLKVNADLDV